MNTPAFLTLVLMLAAAQAQADLPPPPRPLAASADPVPAAPQAETVKPALPPATTSGGSAQTFTAQDIKKIENELKKTMMFVGMGSAVVGLLLGLMIGRATAPGPKIRRF